MSKSTNPKLRELVEANSSLETAEILKIAATKKISATAQGVSRLRNTFQKRIRLESAASLDPDSLRRDSVKATIGSLLVAIGQMLEQL